jgi:hypothetical protein
MNTAIAAQTAAALAIAPTASRSAATPASVTTSPTATVA